MLISYNVELVRQEFLYPVHRGIYYDATAKEKSLMHEALNHEWWPSFDELGETPRVGDIIESKKSYRRQISGPYRLALEVVQIKRVPTFFISDPGEFVRYYVVVVLSKPKDESWYNLTSLYLKAIQNQ